MRRARIKYNQVELDYLIANAHIMRATLTDMFNKKFNRSLTKDQIKSKCTRMGLKTGRLGGRTKGSKFASSYSDTQLQFIKTNRTMTRADLTTAFNKKFGTNKSKSAIQGIANAHGYGTGRTGRFVKGNIPASKGTKGIYGVHPNCRKMQFKKGQTPANAKPLGYKIKWADGYWKILINEKNQHTGYKHRFVLAHRHLWQQHNGIIPPGHKIIFKDSNTDNITIENLCMVKESELARLNTMKYKKAPIELKPALRKIAKLQTKISEVSQ